MFILVTGGSGSGKSVYAEKRMTDFSACRKRYYIATMECRDDESRRRIARHREQRSGKGFETLECPRNLAALAMEPGADALLECMSNLTANEMFLGGQKQDWRNVSEEIMRGVCRLKESCRNLVIVTNEVFSDGTEYDPWTLDYLKCLGKVNTLLAALADEVVEVVYSIPVKIKESDRGENEK
ncbi:MAG: bifunctional adenosylcobinamide kinase/adenosylcobinamide-phosphate guanylyltransferase [Eubacteriales bacterium]|nr:bifunctional adenosylcobinamide kinase/adenosylcobinamide-phosphate guanylyltransferase [Eubacteriales bacterium]